MVNKESEQTLYHHLKEVKEGNRRFENAFQSLSRMIIGDPSKVKKEKLYGKDFHDFLVFREGKKHVVGMYEELEQLVTFIKDGAEGGSAKEQAFVLIGEPGNGKTFLVDYLCSAYRDFTSQKGNEKYTFRFANLDEENYGRIKTIESQTFEDPMILAMNLFQNKEDGIRFLSKQKFSDEQIEGFYKNFRPLGADTGYILNEFKNKLGTEDPDKILENIQIVKVNADKSSGYLTSKYTAKDKITASAIDLIGDESLQRILQLGDENNPYKFNLRRGALARSAGGGIHFADEQFKSKPDLINVYLDAVQSRRINVEGYSWPIDTFIISTSNNEEFNNFKEAREQAPIIDRCKLSFVSHNTNHKLQEQLTAYALGTEIKTNFLGEKMHQDPNLNFALRWGVILSRMPEDERLTSVEIAKLVAGEVVEDKSPKIAREIIDELSQNPDVTQRFGNKGLGQRDLGRAIVEQLSLTETNDGHCMYAEDAFESLKRVVIDYKSEEADRVKYIRAIDLAKGLYRSEVEKTMFDAWMDQPGAVERDVLRYVNMVVAVQGGKYKDGDLWPYKDPQRPEVPKSLKIDERFIDSVEERLGLKTKEQKDSHRQTVESMYAQKIMDLEDNKNYSFMNNSSLVKAVTEVRLKSDINNAGSLIGALSDLNNEINQETYNKVIGTMTNKLNYCDTCAKKTIEYYITHEDVN